MISQYNKEQIEALDIVCEYIRSVSPETIENHKNDTRDYLLFREKISDFSKKNFDHLCKKKCFDSNLSACCTKEGIITYFADMFINAIFSTEDQLKALETALMHPKDTFACVYLGDTGCLWQIKPIVCEMFFCDFLLHEAEKENPNIKDEVSQLKILQKTFTWPDKQIIFNDIEQLFIKRGYHSSLMYMHSSPGLLRVKKNAGLT